MPLMTTDEKFQRLVYVAEWKPDAVERLLKTCAEKGFATPEQILAYAQKVLDNQCLSALRGGDSALDAMVAEAFDIHEQGRKPKGASSNFGM